MSFLAIYAICITVAFVISAFLVHALWTRRLPFPDYGSYAYSCADTRSLFDLVKILKIVIGVEPRFRLDSREVSRAIYASGIILNWNAPSFSARLRNPSGGPIFSVNHPKEAAIGFTKIVRDWGYAALDPVTEEDEDVMVWLVPTNIVKAGVVGFRLPMYKMPKPPLW